MSQNAGRILRIKEGVDDRDKVTMFDAGEAERRSTSSLANMRNALLVVLISVCALAAVALGWFRYISRNALRFDNAQFIVTFLPAPAQCTVSLRDSRSHHALSCADVGAYIRDQLKIPPGALFGTQDMGNTHAPQIAALILALQESGYRSVGTRASFITEPARDR